MKKWIVVILLISSSVLFTDVALAQEKKKDVKFSSKIDVAYSNSMKGIYFALENIPKRKNSVSKELISNNELIAKVKISKEVGGVSVHSVGFYNSYKVSVEIYRDYKSLKDEGFIEYIPRIE